MGILLGLGTALCWGGADLFARFATRKIGTMRTMLYMQFIGTILISLVMPLLGGWGRLFHGPTPAPLWAWGILAGLLNTCSTLGLYRSFELGKMSVVAPLSASYPVLTMILSMLSGEHLTAVRVLGMALAIVGVILVARGEAVPGEVKDAMESGSPAKRFAGVGWALFSAVGFGVMFWLLGIRVVPLLGSAPSVWIIRLTSFSATALVMPVLGRKKDGPAMSVPWWIFFVGLLDTTADVFNNFGMKMEQVSVVSVLASLYGAVTVGLGAVILKERVSRMQWIGIVSIFVGIVLISV
jgi:drug/metabolite transporter (DMT)-like permease